MSFPLNPTLPSITLNTTITFRLGEQAAAISRMTFIKIVFRPVPVWFVGGLVLGLDPDWSSGRGVHIPPPKI